jgi:hypothetical protein
LNETIRTSAQIIDANEMGPVSRTPEGIAQMHARFPREKVDAFLKRVHCIERIREAVLGQN